MNYIKSGNSIVIMIGNSVRPVRADNPLYSTLIKAVRANDEEKVKVLIDKASRIRKHACNKFHVDDEGNVFIGNDLIPCTLANHLLKFLDAKEPIQPLINFWEKLKKNPNPEARRDLYDFLTVNQIPMTEDGLFLAYRRVTDDYKDFHTHSFDNSIGSYVKMKREECDSDRTVTCSRGLHAAAFNYASSIYYNGSGRLVEVLIDPEDVVAVPEDYNQQKMRVCAYMVIRDCNEERKTLIIEEERGLNYRTHYLTGFKKPCKSMTIENVTSHKPTKSGTYATVRASTREEAFKKFMERVS